VDDGRPIELRSDNSAGAAPEIMAGLIDANHGPALAYGADDVTARLTELVREVFEHPGAEVFPVSTGTAANALALSALTPPWGAVLCHETAHIISDEAGATSMFSGGAVMRGLTGPDFTVSSEALAAALESVAWGDPHHSQPAVLSLTIPSDYGTITPPERVAELAAIAKQRGLKVHVDGARIANAIAAIGCAPADLTWRAGVDVFSLGAIKNGALSTDAIVSLDQAVSEQLVYRTKRAGHVASKMRFQSAQLIAYLTDDLWLRLAGDANQTMAGLSRGLTGLGVELVNRVDVNMVFLRLPEPVIAHLEASGLLFYRIAPGLIRFVTSFQTTAHDVDLALARLGAVFAR
jgi:threonine aldolase